MTTRSPAVTPRGHAPANRATAACRSRNVSVAVVPVTGESYISAGVSPAPLDVAVQGVVAGVQPAADEPSEKRRAGSVEHPFPGLSSRCPPPPRSRTPPAAAETAGRFLRSRPSRFAARLRTFGPNRSWHVDLLTHSLCWGTAGLQGRPVAELATDGGRSADGRTVRGGPRRS